MLAGLWSARHLAVGQRMAANDHRAAAATLAADAGLAWARAMLNTGGIDDNCRPTFNTAEDFRARSLRIGAQRHYEAGTGTAAICVSNGLHRWDCRCDGRAPQPTALAPKAGQETFSQQPAFAIRFQNADAPGQLVLIARGCSHLTAACSDPEAPEPETLGLAEHAQHMALLSALRRPPSTPVTEGNNAFLRVFGYPASQYRLQPALTRLRCGSNCAADLRQAFARGRRLIWIEGSVTLREALPRPAGNEPVALLIDGQLDISAAMDFSGLLYARTGIRWTPPAGTRSLVRGALVTDGRWTPGNAVEIQLDAPILQRISHQMGSYLPVPGGWNTHR